MTSRIPITLLTGFLGSGKTTVMRHLADIGALDRTLVLINEFGEIGLDHDLMMPIDEETFVAVDSGCICCTIRADLVETLQQAPWRYAREGVRWFDRVVIETTGIADPAPILQSILGDEKVNSRYALAAVLTTVDAVNGLETLDQHFEAAKQVAVADRILMTKTDLAGGVPDLLEARVAELAPSAPRVIVEHGKAEMEWFLKSGVDSSTSLLRDVEAWLALPAVNGIRPPGESRHGAVSSTSLTIDEPVDPILFETCLEMLLRFRGSDLLRVKGLVNVSGMDRPMVIHGVQHIFHPPEILDTWPSEDHRTRLVMITKDLDRTELMSCFTSLGVPVR